MNNEQIKETGIEYNFKKGNICCMGGDALSDMVNEFNRNRSFEDGARWAEEIVQQELIEQAKKWLESFLEDEWRNLLCRQRTGEIYIPEETVKEFTDYMEKKS